MRMLCKKFGKSFLLLVPLLLGAWGLIGMEGEPVLDALYQSICMYAMGYQETPPNLAVELARWTAPLATASGVLLAFVKVRDSLRRYARYLRGNSVAVYGPKERREALMDRLKEREIDAGEGWNLVLAQNYLLLGSEKENFDFYERNRVRLAKRTVYLETSTLPAQSVSDPGLRLFGSEETAARLFWKQRCPYELSVQNGHRLRLVFIGFGTLGERLLSYALQDNIFDPNQRIEYHLFGGGDRFCAVHGVGLSAISDPVIVHKTPWYENLSLLEEAQMVIVLEQEGQLKLVYDLLMSTTAPVLDIFAAGKGGLELLEGRKRLRLFFWEREAWEPDNIFGDVMFERAKTINLRYAHLYGGVEENGQNREKEWAALDGFTRYSNVSAADYHEVRLHMMQVLGWPADEEKLSPQQLEILAELEHIRWCRYHYLNNWKYGVLENGAGKDRAKRIHTDLLAYGELTEAEKQKDRDNIRVLLSVQ